MQTKVDIINALDTLNSEQLNKVAIYITDIRRAVWGLDGPPVDERPTGAELGPCESLTPDKPPAGYDGNTGKRPLEQPEISSTTIIEAIVEDMGFDTLIKVAKKLNVPHDEIHWDSSMGPDKEDALRVAVAEAMEKVGK